PREVGVSAGGRVTLECVPQPLPHGQSLPFQPGDVVVVSGGARGVTAEVAVALARAFRPTLVLLGRTPEPTAQPAWQAALKDEPALKQELIRRNPDASPRAVGEQVKGVLAGREVAANLGRIRSAGGTVVYRSVDIRSPDLAETILAVRREHGPIRGLIHGAGVLADAHIEDKTSAQFALVYRTKVAGLRALLSAVG